MKILGTVTMTRTKNRRTFLAQSSAAAGILLTKQGKAQSTKQYKAVVIGRTGGGDYGHGLDTIFNGFDNIHVAAVADENPEGLKKAKEKIGCDKAYLDFHEMLETEKPDLVSIGPREPDCHREMALAAIEVGAHIYMEKPITEFPKEGHDIIEAANKKNIKIGMAHTKRFADSYLRIKELIHEGIFGDVLEVRFTGKQDHRVGGEDLIVLGVHDMDMMRFFCGDPQWCFANVQQDGTDATKEDIRKGFEPYTILGDTVRADYQFDNNIQCRWTSVRANADWNQNIKDEGRTILKWGMTLQGTNGALSMMDGIGAFVLNFPFIPSNSDNHQWKPLESLGKPTKPDHLSHPIRDLLYAIEHDQKPQCNGMDGLWAVEMVNAVYQSHKTKARVELPLKDKRHPLQHWD
jgi:predicted dehydrogenase